MKKRGQVTIFIILGIILVIATALVIIFREEITIFKPERVIPSEVAPVITFGDHCLEQISTNAVHLLGAQGGYIYFPSEIENNPLAYIDTGLKVPHWQYLEQNRIPSLPLMEAQLTRYIEEHFNDCLQDFEPFQEEYIIVIKGPIDVETTIGDKNIIFEVNYPLEVQNKEGTKITDVKQFLATSPIQLKKVYEVAKKIMETEARENKVEKLTIDLLALDPDIPLSNVELTCAQKIWHVPDVENKIKTLLRTNLPSLRIDQTSYTEVPKDRPYIENHYIWKVTDIKYPDIKANIQFNENRPLLMQVSPRDGQFLKSGQQKGADMASFICIQMWKFTYSLKYPVIVSVEDIENNFALNYAFDVQIKNNRPSRDILGIPQQFFVQYDATEEAYCAKENLYGDYNMRIFTYDNVSEPGFPESHEPLNKVNITFTCLKYTCQMGQTDFKTGQVLSSLDVQFPYCANGILRAKKTNYQTAQEFVTTAPGKQVSLYLTPLKTISGYSVVKHNIINNELGPAQPLEQDETAFITLSYIQNQTALHTTTGSYPALVGTDLMSLEFLAGGNFPYKTEIFLMDENNLVGGYQGQWTPVWAELSSANQIEFHVIATGAPASEQAMVNLMTQINTLSTEIPPIIK